MRNGQTMFFIFYFYFFCLLLFGALDNGLICLTVQPPFFFFFWSINFMMKALKRLHYFTLFIFFFFQPDQVHLDDDNKCIYPKSSATALGTLALLPILLSEIITSVATGCICCCKRGPQPTSCNWTVAQVCFVLSW